MHVLHEPNEPAMVASNLSRSLVIVLTIKTLVIALAAIFVFGPSQRPQIDAGALDRQILGNSNSVNQEHMR